MGEYFIKTVNGTVLDVSDESYENGKDIIQWEKHGGANQRWRIERD